MTEGMATKPEGRWIEWAGGKRPVNADTQVEVRYRGESMLLRDPHGRASDFDWRHYSTLEGEQSSGDIIAYREVQP